jgi:hypothetical protein
VVIASKRGEYEKQMARIQVEEEIQKMCTSSTEEPPTLEDLPE